jgi:hypothetical protein
MIMSTETEAPIHQDGSPVGEEAKTEAAFNPGILEAGVDNGEGEERESAVDPRLAIIEAASNRVDADRVEQNDLEVVEEEDPDPEPGLQYQEELNPSEKETTGMEQFAGDPLEEFIELDANGQPMFRSVVNGQQQLIPLDKARATIQKHESADQRLQEAASWKQTLEQREQALVARETDLQVKLAGMHEEQSGAPSDTDANLNDDVDLEAEAREVVSGLFTGTEDEAAVKLADLLKKTKGAAPAATPQVDPQELADRAAATVRQQLTAEQQEKDINDGYQKFIKDYPEIAADDVLFDFADSMTDKIRAEHPDWTPSQVMLEAGAKVRERVGTPAPEQTPAIVDETRQERKRNLRPLPAARQGVQETEPEERPETPTDVLAGIREARGQVM